MKAIKAEKWWVEQSRKNPVTFIHYMTDKAPARHHLIWLANLIHPDRKRLNFIAPRESAKSTILSLFLAWSIGHKPLTSNAFVSVSSRQAKDRLSSLRTTIESTRFQNVFPGIVIDDNRPNTHEMFTVANTAMPYSSWRSIVSRFGNPMSHTMFTCGVGGKGVIGMRFNGYLILDDIIDENYLSVPLQDNIEQYIMQTLIPCVQEDGKVVNIGTRWMLEDIPERLTKNPAWHTVQIPAIIDGQSYWPEYWPLERLKNKRIEMNNDVLFRVMYLNDPTAMTAALFTSDSLDQDLPSPLPKLSSLFISTDFAMKAKASSDFSVFLAVGIDYKGNYHILDMDRLKATPEKAIAALVAFATKIIFRYSRLTNILIEDVGFQGTFLTLLRQKRPDLPVRLVHPTGDKHSRAGAVSYLAENKRLFINQKMKFTDILKEEWLNFPLHKHDDTLDPMSLLCQFTIGEQRNAEVHKITSPYLL